MNVLVLFQNQESIPVGCVPPARWPFPVVSDGEEDSAQPPWMQTSPPDADPLGCSPLLNADTPLDADPLPRMQSPLDAEPPECRPTPVDRMTDACENITLPQTSFAGGNNVTNSCIQFLCTALWQLLAVTTRGWCRISLQEFVLLWFRQMTPKFKWSCVPVVQTSVLVFHVMLDRCSTKDDRKLAQKTQHDV